MKLWSENIPGNLHDATKALNNRRISDIVTMQYQPGVNVTIVVYRISEDEYLQRKNFLTS